MFTLKEKVTERLSRLFADSPDSSSSSSLPPSLDHHHPEARPDSKGGKSMSSYFSYIIPSVGFGESRSGKHQRSLSASNVDFESQDESLHRYVECRSPGENKETENNRESNYDHVSGGSTSGSEVFEEATDQHSPQKHLSYLMDDSVFISSDLQEFLLSSLPNIVKGCQWVLLYSTLKHGISLRTLIRKSSDLSGPCLLARCCVWWTSRGPLETYGKRKYQGTNQTFVFTTIYGEPRLFRPTGANRYYYMCLNDMLALGGGGNYALCLDGDLLSGTSGPCETFGNLCLAHNSEFELKNVELWGFTHASRYLP